MGSSQSRSNKMPSAETWEILSGGRHSGPLLVKVHDGHALAALVLGRRLKGAHQRVPR